MSGALTEFFDIPPVAEKAHAPRSLNEPLISRLGQKRTPGDVKSFLLVMDDIQHMCPLSGYRYSGYRSSWRRGFISSLVGLPTDNGESESWQRGHEAGMVYLKGVYCEHKGEKTS